MNLNQRHCLPCKSGSPPMTEVDENRHFADLVGWELVREGTHLIRKETKFKRYLDGITFAARVGGVADSEDHHPTIHIYYRKVVVELFTHTVGGLSINDFIVASKIDAMEEPVS